MTTPSTAQPNAADSSAARTTSGETTAVYVPENRKLVIELPGFGWELAGVSGADNLVLSIPTVLPARNVQQVYTTAGINYAIEVPESLPANFKLTFSRTRLSDGSRETRYFLVFGQETDSPAGPATELAGAVNAALVSPPAQIPQVQTSADESLFRLARSLATEGTNNSVREAVRLFRQIVTDYPLSNHYDDSVAAIRDLERRYIMVR